MHTVDHYIRAKLRRRYRKIIRKAKMCTMSFIHDQRQSFFMCGLCYLDHIRHNSIVSRRYNHDCSDLWIPIKGPPHILCGYLNIQL